MINPAAFPAWPWFAVKAAGLSAPLEIDLSAHPGYYRGEWIGNDFQSTPERLRAEAEIDRRLDARP